jgi:hypothetical protein
MMVFAIQHSIEHDDDYGISYTHENLLYLGLWESEEDAQAVCDEHNEPLIQKLVSAHVHAHRQKYTADQRTVAEYNALVDAGLRDGPHKIYSVADTPPAFELPEDYANKYEVVGRSVKPASNREETPS